MRRRRRLSMTSLIDVIFLLLLFFMLSSTFTRFAEVELASARSGSTASSSDRPVFLSFAADALRVNGVDAALDALPEALEAHRSDDRRLGVLVAAGADVTAQRLTDLLVALRAIPSVTVTVLEAS